MESTQLVEENKELLSLIGEKIDAESFNKLLKDLKDAVILNKEGKAFGGGIYHYGKPPGLHECSKCRNNFDASHFTYYSKRVDKNNYLMRSNALCTVCSIEMNSERKSTLTKAKKNNEIGKKPEPGAKCPGCDRNWGTQEQPRNGHRDHDAIKNVFRGWLCGDCNMAKHDHRHNIS